MIRAAELLLTLLLLLIFFRRISRLRAEGGA